MLENTLVSVCIPSYNNGHYIDKTLKSIIGQSYKNLDIVVCDNGSCDQTKEVVASFNDTRIRYIKNPVNIGSTKIFNRLIELARGDVMAIYHSDDIYEPSIVNSELDFLTKYPEAGAVFTLDKLIDEKGQKIGPGMRLPDALEKKDVYDFEDVLREMLKGTGSFLLCPTLMVKKEVFEVVGCFNENKYGNEAGSAADMEMWLRIALRYKLGIVKEPLINRRISKAQGSCSYEAIRLTRANRYQVLDDYISQYTQVSNLNKDVLGQYEFNKLFDDMLIAKNYLKLDKLEEAKQVLFCSFNKNKFLIGFKTKKNFCILLIFFMFSVTLFFGLPKLGIVLFKAVNRLKPTVPF